MMKYVRLKFPCFGISWLVWFNAMPAAEATSWRENVMLSEMVINKETP